MLRIHRGGGLVVAGTDSPLDIVAVSLHANLRSMVAGGFTPYEALTTATRNPATWLNVEDKLGVVRPGAQADLAFVRGNPLSDIRTAADVQQVRVAGKLRVLVARARVAAPRLLRRLTGSAVASEGKAPPHGTPATIERSAAASASGTVSRGRGSRG
jgi:adenine deaminase